MNQFESLVRCSRRRRGLRASCLCKPRGQLQLTTSICVPFLVGTRNGFGVPPLVSHIKKSAIRSGTSVFSEMYPKPCFSLGCLPGPCSVCAISCHVLQRALSFRMFWSASPWTLNSGISPAPLRLSIARARRHGVAGLCSPSSPPPL